MVYNVLLLPVTLWGLMTHPACIFMVYLKLTSPQTDVSTDLGNCSLLLNRPYSKNGVLDAERFSTET